MKKGVQLYAVRGVAKDSLENALKAVSEIGYEGVEFAGFFGHTAEQVLALLKKYGLAALGAHVAPEEMFEKADETIAFHTAIGNSRVICPWYDMSSKAEVLELAEKLKSVASKYTAAGIKLYYHNHAHEFKKDSATGEYLIDILADEVGADILSLELDVYWVYRGGECPVKYLEKYNDRADIFHAKDGEGENGTTLGKGAVDIAGVFEFVNKNNFEWAVVESEASEEPDKQLQAIREDYEELIKLIP